METEKAGSKLLPCTNGCNYGNETDIIIRSFRAKDITLRYALCLEPPGVHDILNYYGVFLLEQVEALLLIELSFDMHSRVSCTTIVVWGIIDDTEKTDSTVPKPG